MGAHRRGAARTRIARTFASHRLALCRKWVRKCARKYARKPETCVCIVFCVTSNICGGVCGAFWGSFLDSVCEHIVLALHTYGHANTFLRKRPSMNKPYSMGGNCMKKWEVQRRTIMQFSFVLQVGCPV